jgi:quinol-cytochrome oxidoreductase complex cytochrome b subunit
MTARTGGWGPTPDAHTFPTRRYDLVKTNFDAQWISTQAKDGLNAAGIGAWFNVMDLGQMMLWHVSLLPLVVGAIVVVHIVLVRRHGVVPPIGATEPSVAPGDRSPTPSMPPGVQP